MFKNRIDAGLQLAPKLIGARSEVVVGLARGGVVVASVISSKLKIPLYALIVKKIPSPNDPELGLGAVTLAGVSFINEKAINFTQASQSYLNEKIANLKAEIAQIHKQYSPHQININWVNSSVILTDDGVAMGGSIRAAISWLRLRHVKRIIIAMPVAPQEFIQEMKPLVNEIIVIESLGPDRSVGSAYLDFSAVTHEKVIELLKVG
jgi:putative phosphoribosyl transferase